MALNILVNSAWEYASRVLVTDTSNVDTSESDTVENVVSGSPHVFWQSGNTADKRIAYIDKNNRLSCTHFVLTRADLHVGHQIKLYEATTYSSSISLITNTANPLAVGSLIGKTNQDLVIPCAATTVEALIAEFVAGTGGNYTKKVYQMYFANSFVVNYPRTVTRSSKPFPSYYKLLNKSYLVDANWTFSIGDLSLSEVNNFERLFNLRTEPFFIYDQDGNHIRFNLLHCMLEAYDITQLGNDVYLLSLTVNELRRW